MKSLARTWQLYLTIYKSYVNEIVENESDDDCDTEWGLDGDFERNAFDFIIDDEQY